MEVEDYEKLLKNVYRSAPIGLCLLDTELRYRHINEWLASINGLSVEAHLGRTISEVLPEVSAGVESLLRRVMETGEPVLDGVVEAGTPASPHQTRIFLHSYHAIRSDEGIVVGVSCIVQDITERKRAEDALVEARNQLETRVQARTAELTQIELRQRLLLESFQAVPWEADATTYQFTYVGPRAVGLLGFPSQQWLESDFWPLHIHPEDRKLAIDYCVQSAKSKTDFAFEYRMITADGSTVWIHDIVNVEFEAGEPKTLRGIMIDITERKLAQEALRASEAALRRRESEYRELAGKLLTAQEEERRRLAREMHDDLSQRLAVLAIDAGKLEQQLASSGGRVPEKLCEMRAGIVKLSEDVHAIARALHPSLLDDLGLIAAIESECASFSEREGIAVTFEPNDFSVSVPKDVALCIYRITQEGLRNIAKHARADDAHVGLTVVDGTLVLSINDGGTGFDPAQARERGGLGLASMHERVRLIDGDLRVDSQPGQGTMIQVRVPLSGRSR